MEHPIRILTIEDSEIDTELTMQELKDSGLAITYLRVDTEEEMRSALALSEWDIILCDYGMPRFDAYGALQVVKQSELDIPFVVLSGTIGEENLIRLMKYGCHDCVMKYNLKRLPTVVARELRDAAIRRENRAMKERLEKFELLVRYAKDPMLFVDETGRIIEVNHACETVYGYSREELLELTVMDLRRDDAVNIKAQMEAAQQGGVLFETVHYSKEGVAIPVEVRSQGAVILGRTTLLSIVRDITDRKRLEQRLLAAKEHAEAASKSKSSFLANMSHEIRTPLNGIIGMTELLILTELSQEQQEYMGMVKLSSQSLLRVVNDILDYSRLEVEKMSLTHQPFQLRQTVASVQDLFLVTALQRGIALETFVEGSVEDLLVGDAIRIKQILSNIIGNAVKFTESGGVTMRVSQLPSQDDRVCLRFSIKDTGIGISEANLNQLFQSFYQVDNSLVRRHGGSGLGLSIAKGLVEQMGGDMRCTSQEGVGTEFIFTLMLERSHEIPEPEPVLETGVATDRVARLLPAHILLVEDDVTSRAVAKLLLERSGYRVSVATDGEEACRKAIEGTFDLVLMDISLPKLDGYAAVKCIREAGKMDLTIVAMTAYALSGDRERCLEAGMNDYLSKPVSRVALTAMLEKWL